MSRSGNLPIPTTPAARNAKWPALLLLTLCCSACSTVTTRKTTGEEVVMSRQEFEHYVEQVFRYHNQVMNDLIESAGDRLEQDEAESRALKLAEEKMVSSCRPLNEIVAESMSGENPGLTVKMELADSVPACEAASKTVDELIP